MILESLAEPGLSKTQRFNRCCRGFFMYFSNHTALQVISSAAVIRILLKADDRRKNAKEHIANLPTNLSGTSGTSLRNKS